MITEFTCMPVVFTTYEPCNIYICVCVCVCVYIHIHYIYISLGFAEKGLHSASMLKGNIVFFLLLKCTSEK